MTEPPEIPATPEAPARRGDRPRKPGVGGLPHRTVVEVLTEGVGDDWGPPGHGEVSRVSRILLDARLIELAEDGPHYRCRRTARGREWLKRFVSPFATAL